MTWAGYIKETEALQPDVAEAMSGMAGAGVEAFSAEEIQAVGIAPQLMAYLASYQASNAISAEVGGNINTVPQTITFEITYDVSGANADDIMPRLEAYSEDLVDLIRSVIEEDRVNARRMSYD